MWGGSEGEEGGGRREEDMRSLGPRAGARPGFSTCPSKGLTGLPWGSA